MSLQRSLQPYFTFLTRGDGDLLVHRNAVKLLSAGPTEVTAEVFDKEVNETHIVALEREFRLIYPSCTCDIFQLEPCAHIWATLRKCDDRAALGAFDSNGVRLNWREGRDRMRAAPAGEPAAPPSFLRRAARRREKQAQSATPTPPQPRPPQWSLDLKQLQLDESYRPPPPRVDTSREREYYFVIDLERARYGLCVEICCRERKTDGGWGKLKEARLTWEHIENLGDAPEEKVIRAAVGRPSPNSDLTGPTYVYALNRKSSRDLLAQMAATGRLLLRNNNRVDLKDCRVLHWDERPAQYSVQMEKIGDEWRLHPRFEIPGMEPMETVTLASPTGLMIAQERICPVDFASGYSWVQLLSRRPDFRVPVEQEQEFVHEITKLASARAVVLPEHLRFTELHPAPTPVLRLKFDAATEASGQTRATFEIHYDGLIVKTSTPAVLQDAATRTLTHRDMAREAAIRDELTAEGFKLCDRYGYYTGTEDDYQVKTTRLAGALSNLLKKQWRIESEGRPFRTAGDFSAKLTTGIDWFELEAELNFDGVKVRLPELLKALAKGNTMVSLSDGSIGLLPDEFLARYGGLLSMAKAEGDQVVFSRSQAGILDVLLHDLPEIKPDERLGKIREGIQRFAGIAPDEQPAGFSGELRGYQREGLAWMRFLEGIDLGGCLADDMGVGKTPQVLALLERRRAEGFGPSLVVVPRSLIFNWKEEAARFTPSLQVLDYSHAERDKTGESFGGCHLVLTTYGTLLRDITTLREFPFDYAILDEAQAIKNSGSESAKAARLIKARHRLVMTGTPIENHLGELWSLFEFLNPGMLGSLSVFQATGKALRSIDEANRAMLARALRPFILRRTKGQVAKELPERIEQTIHCELEGKQKQLYDELRDFYRAKLLGKAGKDLQKTKFQVLEALLRLRQAACHPGLIDAKHAAVPSSKLDTLMERLDQVIGEGHKALVFSQFTSLLDLVRKRFHKAGIRYEYLDGSTSNREEHVKAFQNDANCSVFLISLKAGGVGLNLTAAEYVFLLDPWWNPAAEAQAIDRAHRIGQTRTVVASRLIAQGTVEERVLELQRSKRELAEAIIGEDNRLIGNLQREDLELLLS